PRARGRTSSRRCSKRSAFRQGRSAPRASGWPRSRSSPGTRTSTCSARRAEMRICSPHCGIAPESGSGGEVYERELLRGLAALGDECHILLARGKPYERGIPGWTIHPVWPPKGLRWYVTPFVWPRYIRRLCDAPGFDLLRAHWVRSVGPAALLARRRYRLPVPVVTHHHHLDPSPLNPLIEKRVIEASDSVVTDSQFAKRQLADELGVRTDHVRVVYCGVGTKYTPGARDEALAPRCGLRATQGRL